MTYETLAVECSNHVANIVLNRPDKANAMNREFWKEIRMAFEWADATPDVRVVVLSANGKTFSAGIDLEILMSVTAITNTTDCEARIREELRQMLLNLQRSLTAIEQCRKPVIAAVHGACIGGGVDMIAACDMRFCSADAGFSIKEIDIGMVADLGTLQRLPKIMPDGIVRELAYTGRTVSGAEAERIGLVNRHFDTNEALMKHVKTLAAEIATKSPLSIRGTKEMLLYSRDHSVADGLSHVATWNAAMFLSADIREAFTAKTEKRKPKFKD